MNRDANMTINLLNAPAGVGVAVVVRLLGVGVAP